MQEKATELQETVDILKDQMRFYCNEACTARINGDDEKADDMWRLHDDAAAALRAIDRIK